jgi:hypothetical protein
VKIKKIAITKLDNFEETWVIQIYEEVPAGVIETRESLTASFYSRIEPEVVKT